MKYNLLKNDAGLILLIAGGLLSWIVWLTEVCIRGWGGLFWTVNFHYAIPFGILLFLTWLGFEIGKLSSVKNLMYILITGLYAIVAFVSGEWSMGYFFGAHMFWPPLEITWLYKVEVMLLVYSLFFVLPSISVCFYEISYWFGVKSTRMVYGIGFGLFVGAIPLGIVLLHLSGYSSIGNAIHTVKTGVCIPFLFVGLGLPVHYRKRIADKKQKNYGGFFKWVNQS